MNQPEFGRFSPNWWAEVYLYLQIVDSKGINCSNISNEHKMTPITKKSVKFTRFGGEQKKVKFCENIEKETIDTKKTMPLKFESQIWKHQIGFPTSVIAEK